MTDTAAARAQWLRDYAEDTGPEPPHPLLILARSYQHAAYVAVHTLGLKFRQWRYVAHIPMLLGTGRHHRFYITDTFWERTDAHELYECATVNRQMVEVTSEELNAMRREGYTVSNGDDLVAFIQARLDETEACVRNDIAWWFGEGAVIDVYAAAGPAPVLVAGGGDYVRPFIDPASVLRGVEAKRKIAKLHASGGDHDCPGAWVGDSDDPQEPCPTLRLLASEWSGHPDWRQEWAP